MTFSANRYDSMIYRRCGRSGLKLPAISLGCWHNFGRHANHDESRKMLHRAFDLGITHFDLANNYGPPPGSAEEFVGKTLAQDFEGHRDELIISTKAGYLMWPGPYGEWGSRKYLLASLDQSLKRLGLNYVDIFYSHRPDSHTPLEETIGALDSAVRQGKALYVGISSYDGAMTEAAMEIALELRTPLIIHQPSYSMLNRWIESDLLPQTSRFGLGLIAFCPLSQGLLTDKYLAGIPHDSRAASPDGFLRPEHVTPDAIAKVKLLNEIARRRGQSMAQMALAWVLRDEAVTSALIGASRVKQIDDNVAALANLKFSAAELQEIDRILAR
ncbi:MAG TPA: L-glyceraldehyde 3-phosphate reductase [Verrucomicrobiae bacterium]|nr:L-glyceraldehyde 3-phosphate reductase [Verrucomicrobiae bacterium]